MQGQGQGEGEGEGEGLEQCPSFNSYSVDGLAETAARVIRELNELDAETSGLNRPGSIFSVDDVDGGSFDADFEFVSLAQTGELAVFFDESIGTVFPVFNHDLLSEEDAEAKVDDQQDSERSIRIPLEKLIIGDRDTDPLPSSSSSSSEVDELEAIQPGTYCVWTPKKAESTDGKCKKSKSTGSSSKRWKLIDLLRRSNSDGKDSLVFLAPSSKSSSARKEEIKAETIESSKESKSTGEGKVAEKSKARRISNERAVSAHELFYVRNRMLKEEGKKRSYLPYRKDLVGFWANIPSLGKTFPPPF